MDKKLVSPISFMSDEERKEATVNLRNEILEANRQDPEHREYTLLYYADEEGEEIKSFEEITGRTALRKFIIGIVEYMDIHKSKVLVEGNLVEDALSVYKFMKLMSDRGYYEDSFDIEDYNKGDID